MRIDSDEIVASRVCHPSDGRHDSVLNSGITYRRPNGIDHAKVDYKRLTTQDVFSDSDRFLRREPIKAARVIYFGMNASIWVSPNTRTYGINLDRIFKS